MKRCHGPFYELARVPSISKTDFWELASRKLISKDSKGYDYFTQAGVFSTKKGIYVVVPWILKNQNPDYDSTPTTLLQGYSSFRWFKQLFDFSLGKQTEAANGKEFVLTSMYFAMKDLIEQGMRFNVFRQETQTITAIKGKWHVERDLRRTHVPVTFACTIDECNTKHPILGIAIAFCDEFARLARSPNLQRSITELRHRLSLLASPPQDIKETLHEAKNLALRDRRFLPWLDWVSAADSILEQTGAERSLSDVSMMDDFSFDTAGFFEEAVMRILVDGCNFTAKAQESDQLLGGAYWSEANGDHGVEELFKEMNARQSSRPDYLVSLDTGKTLLVECKYKRLIPVVINNGSKKAVKLSGLQREDRNQILSFVLSKSKELNFISDAIVVLYPIVEEENSPTFIPRLTFRADQMLVGDLSSVIWEKSSKRKGISVCFLGIQLAPALKAIEKRETNHPELIRIREFLTRVSGNEK